MLQVVCSAYLLFGRLNEEKDDAGAMLITMHSHSYRCNDNFLIYYTITTVIRTSY